MIKMKQQMQKYSEHFFSKLVGTKKEVFLVLVRQFSRVNIYWFNKEKTLWTFDISNPIRKWAIYIITNKLFDFFMITTVIINCLFLAMNNAPEVAEYVFTGIYTLEMILKIFAKGLLLHHYAYLRDGWNILDFIVVVLGYITLLPGVANLSGISIFRVLRALRTISSIEGLKTMVNALLNAMAMMSSVIILTTFFVCIFALFGLQLFAGVFRQKCVLNAIVYNSSESWVVQIQNSSNWYNGIQICGNNSGSLNCPKNFTCQQNAAPNPNYGFTSFDNIGWAILTSFQIINRDFWEDVYIGVISALGPWYIFYFLVIIFFGSFFLINLILAVVVFSYQHETTCVVDFSAQFRLLHQVLSPYYDDLYILPKIIVENSIIDRIKNLSCMKLNSNTFALPLQDESLNLRQRRMTYELASINKKDTIVESRNTIINGKNVPSCSDLESSINPKNDFSRNHQASVRKRLASQSTLASEYYIRFSSPIHYLRKFRKKLNQFLVSSLFDNVILVSILMNTVCLALETHNMQVKLKNSLRIANYLFTAIFLAEMLLKIIALNLKHYAKQMWNLLDSLVVVLSIIEIILETTSFSTQTGFTIIRSLRLFRIFKLAKSWKTMRLLFTTIARSLTALGSITLILLIVLYMFAVIGTKCFGHKYKPEVFPNKKIPVWNFIDFYHSFMMIFRVLCGEWIEPLHDTMLVAGTWSIPFFLIVLFVGNFLVLNLFVALLLNSFAVRVMEENLKKRKARLNWVTAVKKVNSVRRAFKKHESILEVTANQENFESQENDVFRIDSISEKLETLSSKEKVNQITKSTSERNWINLLQDNFKLKPQFLYSNKKISRSFSKDSSCKNGDPHKECQPLKTYNKEELPLKTSDINLENKSVLFCSFFVFCLKNSSGIKTVLKKISNLRKKVKKFVKHKWFNNIVLILIAASSFVLVFDDIRLSSKPLLSKMLEKCNTVFAILFLVEFFLKIFALGFVKFLRNPWNSFETANAIVSLASVLNEYARIVTNVNAIRSLRTLRALRPLRAISHWKGIKIVVNSLLAAIPSIGNVFLVCILFWLIFSILGVQLFGGKFYKCINEHNERIDASIIPNKTMCLAHGFQWKNSNANFDNALNGFLPLFQVAVFEGWIEIMRDAVDATEVDMQPISGNNFFAHMYFVVFIIFGAFFILNLFVSVIIDNFYRLKKQFDGCKTVEVNLSALQKQWFLSVKNALSKKSNRLLQRPKGCYFSKLFDTITSPKYEAFIIIMVVCNILLMMTHHYNQSEWVTRFLNRTNLIFTAIFSLELVLRLIVLRCHYFSNSWNIFDLVVVFLSVIGILIEYFEVTLSTSPNIFRFARILRISRLLRYFNSGKGIRRLMIALIVSLPALLNIGALLFLILFIYSIIGMSTFGHVKKQGALSEVVNFETFGNSIMVLFRLATSAGWNEILDALVVQPPNCDENFNGLPNGNCGTPWAAAIYLISFIIITFLIIINLYIAIILENFNEVHRHDDIGITDEDIEMFYSVWQLYDPSNTNYIEFQKLPFLVANLGSPLGIPFPNRIAVHNLNLPIIEGDKIHCVDVLQGLLKRKFEGDSESFMSICDAVDRTLENAFPDRLKYTSRTTTMIRFQEIKAAYTIQKYYKKWKEKKEMSKQIECDSDLAAIRFAYSSMTSLKSYSQMQNKRNDVLETCKSNGNMLHNFYIKKRTQSFPNKSELTRFNNLRKTNRGNRMSLTFNKRRSEIVQLDVH
ncbi:sodium channel protein 1 brain isoform X5 [Hydra vulgaris]|uniref:Sodium channel protein n=2 Tax=Hydra vulgaris TaxID=6087 RepID=A0ABM4DD93_HYDVU